MPLTQKSIQNLAPLEKPYKKYDSQGLYIEVKPTGSKLWRFKFTFEGKSKLLALGKYPTISLKEARNLRDQAKQQLYQGIDPAQAKQQLKKTQVKQQLMAENTFEKLAGEWWNAQKARWSDNYANTTWRRIESNLLPWIGKMPVLEIEPSFLLEQIRRMEKRGAYDASHRVLQLAGAIFRYGIAVGKGDRDPAADIKDALIKVPVKNLSAITEPKEIKSLLRAIDSYPFSMIVYTALQMSALTFLRPGELRKATWDELDFKDAIWKIPAERMKSRKEHIVPLSRQSVFFLNELRPLTENCKGNYVFPGMRMNGRPMSENTVVTALRSMGFAQEKMCAHGFRTMASTRLHESGLWDSRVIEIQLAHVDQNTIRGIYNRAIYLEDRRKMMQWWADYLDSLRDGAKIMPAMISSGE